MLGLFLVGCNDPHDDVQAAMAGIKTQPAPKIPPIPAFYEKRVVLYDVGGLRSPFISMPTFLKSKTYTPKYIFVDLNRKPQPLEFFSLESLLFSGVLSKGGKLDAMIQTPEGDVAVARIGDYIGQNHGKIISITKDSMTVLEAISDGEDKWLESYKTLNVVSPDLPIKKSP